ncbi:TlpA disulfide reductase family protein [Thermomicrobium sp. 4228-Ro]|uniref:TlpA family protein disulfide reductase n=1 Tax=Thermomicrobium sp. 4228-Ro TaxID=2993937 RepID=UPI002248F42D|nr:TlpA disulfide reductase family protein [Thermomicrobium sp. 4228-Ro]MCX2728362.1 TlpA disulfide reductase family protein [Thermomicrobium sp. 4228-Ro]
MSTRTTRRTPRSRGQRTVLLGFVLTLVLLGTVVVLLFRGRAPAALPGTASLSSAPLVTLTLDDGRSTLEIGGPSSGPVVLYTVASWCPSCVPGAQVLATLAPEFSTVRFVLLSVDPTDSPAMMEEFLRRAGIPPGTLRYALDANGTAARRLGARGLDQLIVFDSGGHVIFTGIGAPQEEQLRRVLRSLSSDRGTSSGAAEHAALALQ